MAFEGLPDSGDEPAHRLEVGDVADDRQSSFPRQGAGDGFELVLVDITQHDVGPLAGEALHFASAHRRCRSGHHHGLALERCMSMLLGWMT